MTWLEDAGWLLGREEDTPVSLLVMRFVSIFPGTQQALQQQTHGWLRLLHGQAPYIQAELLVTEVSADFPCYLGLMFPIAEFRCSGLDRGVTHSGW